MIQEVLNKWLRLHANKIPFKDTEPSNRAEFANFMFKYPGFSAMKTFHINSPVTCICKIWGVEHKHEVPPPFTSHSTQRKQYL
jgi:hypothetical protein